MKLKELIQGYTAVLHLWQAGSLPSMGGTKSWTVFVKQPKIAMLSDEDRRNIRIWDSELNIALRDPSNNEEVLKRKPPVAVRDMYGLNSDDFNAFVLRCKPHMGHVYKSPNMLEKEIDHATLRYAPLTKEAFLKIDPGRTFSIALLNIQPVMGTDGTVYGMSIEAGTCTFEMSWWETGAPEWHELTTWARVTMDLLESIVERYTTANEIHDGQQNE